MKFIEFDGERFVFEFGERERRWFSDSLARYPLIPVSYQQLSKSADLEENDSNQKLLEEALAEQRSENRRQLTAMLDEAGRFSKTDSGIQIRLTSQEIEWLLQVFNDLRVGSWIQLGQPDEAKNATMEVTRENAVFLWMMELSGYFQSVLLSAIQP